MSTRIVFAALIGSCGLLGSASFAFSQVITEYPTTTPGSAPAEIVTGPDGNLWFLETFSNNIGVMSPSGAMLHEYPITSPNSFPAGMTVGPDNNIWFTENFTDKIGRITMAGVVTEFNVTPGAGPWGITKGPDGNLWFTEQNSSRIGVMSPSGVLLHEYPTTTANSAPFGITTGADGNLWFTEIAGPAVARITPDGHVTEFPITTPNAEMEGIALGPDGNVWFAECDGNTIGRITPSGTITEFPLNGQPLRLAAGPDGNIWYTETTGNKIARIRPDGSVISETPIPSPNTLPLGITLGPDGAMWFVEQASSLIGRIKTQALIVSGQNFSAAGNAGGPFSPTSVKLTVKSTSDTADFSVSNLPPWLTATPATGTATKTGAIVSLDVNSNANSLAVGTYGPIAVSITNTTNGIGNATRNATLTVGDFGTTAVLSAVLPASRSVQVPTPATAFTTIINSGSNVAINCGLSLDSAVPATFSYQTTDPATNAATGIANTPVNVAAGHNQSYVFSITPSAPFDSADLHIGTTCANAPSAAVVVGLNTLLMSASTSAVADIVALAATSNNDGILTVPAGGSAAFAAATVNVGAGASITVSADTGSAALPLTLQLCQTDPGTGLCTSGMSATVTTTIAPNATPTFAIFATATGAIPFDPANKRIFVRFKDGGGVTRGATSVAVRTQ